MDGLAPCCCGFRSVGRTDNGHTGDSAQRGQLFNRLVGRPVFTYSDAVMGKNVYQRQFHQGGYAYGRSHIVGKYQKRSAVRPQAVMQKHTGHNSSHGVLPNAKTNIAAVVCIFLEFMGKL